MTETWSYDDIGYPQDIEITEISHVIEHNYGGGYMASRPEAKKMQKRFDLIYPGSPTANWLNFVEFWRSVYGAADAFYWEFPVSLYGSPSYGGLNIGEPADGFDTDQEVYYGCGAVFTCRFAEKQLPQRYKSFFPGLWAFTVSIVEVA